MIEIRRIIDAPCYANLTDRECSVGQHHGTVCEVAVSTGVGQCDLGLVDTRSVLLFCRGLDVIDLLDARLRQRDGIVGFQRPRTLRFCEVLLSVAASFTMASKSLSLDARGAGSPTTSLTSMLVSRPNALPPPTDQIPALVS
jgi:hypothetical protein